MKNHSSADRASHKLEAFVVGSEGHLRNRDLPDQVQRAGLPLPHIVGVFPTQEDLELLTDPAAARRIFGRELTRGEVGCWHSHREVYRRLVRARGWSALVVEDDMVVNPSQLCWSLRAQERILASNQPRIVVLYSHSTPEDVFGRQAARDGHAREGGIYRCLVPPKGTAAYVINRPAALLALTASPRAVTTADWPPWTAKVHFFLATDAGIHEGPSPSIIQERRLLTHQERMIKWRNWMSVTTRWSGAADIAGGKRGAWMMYTIRANLMPAIARARYRLRKRWPNLHGHHD
jgi:GR25 family glycosyltransferase involved in LPS biosynthesis